MRTWTGFVVIAAGLLLLSGCSSDDPASTSRPAALTGVSVVEDFLEAEGLAVLNGLVMDEGGLGLPGATVFVKVCDGTPDTGEHAFQTLTDEAGAFTIEGIPAGEYSVVVCLVGYLKATIPVVFPEEGTVVLEVTLVSAARQQGHHYSGERKRGKPELPVQAHRR